MTQPSTACPLKKDGNEDGADLIGSKESSGLAKLGIYVNQGSPKRIPAGMWADEVRGFRAVPLVKLQPF